MIADDSYDEDSNADRLLSRLLGLDLEAEGLVGMVLGRVEAAGGLEPEALSHGPEGYLEELELDLDDGIRLRLELKEPESMELEARVFVLPARGERLRLEPRQGGIWERLLP